MSRVASPDDQLALARALTQRVQLLCLGLEHGEAEILELVTPTTAELLGWWFSADACQSRAFNFHAGQRQAILNTIVAHEVLDSPNLADLYRQVCADELLKDGRLLEVEQGKHAHPKYCLKMATGTGKTWVLQALLVWQMLNRSAGLAVGIDDPRFTRHFLIVAPGLIVYERLLDAFLGKEGADGQRRFETSDVAVCRELFVPPGYREQVEQFVRGNVCTKQEIGLKATGGGMIAITNWHLLVDAEAEEEQQEAEDASLATPGMVADAAAVAYDLLPLTPGRATGNSLDVLDRRWARGNVLAYLAGIPRLMVFNDEAHHIHELKREGEADEVEWQKSLSRIAAGKGRHFVQVDFSATPYNDVGGGKKKRKLYFPHIVVDFDLKDAMRAGLVKSLVLDKRKEIGALPLEFKAERDENGNATLSEGQRVMLRAGLHKLRKLEADFAKLDPVRKPKMLVVCEDTKVSPLVSDFLRDQGLEESDVLTVDSGKKEDIGEKEWARVRQQLFDVDRRAQPRVIVSVLMLREGFDVNNICVIVPLRSSQAQILLEQTIGRGLRLMWREPEYIDSKRENRERINRGEEPDSLIDILSIVEHPAFQSFYDEQLGKELVGEIRDDLESNIGDQILVELRPDYQKYDFAIPFILREAEETLEHMPIDIADLQPFGGMTREQLSDLVGKGDVFTSHDLQSSTLFGDYRVDGAVMNVGGYNEWLSRLTRRITQALSQPLPVGGKVAYHLAKPYTQVGSAVMATAIDDYIRSRLFREEFEPFENENWRLLMLQPVVDHVIKVFALALRNAEDHNTSGEIEVRHRRLSEVSRLPMRESASLEVEKCIYPRLPYPSRSGGLERTFIEWALHDASVAAFCKISETRHDFARLRYVKDSGMPAFYSPDFLVRMADAIYLVETKAQDQTSHPNVQRKRRAAAAWCERINALPPELRSGLPWHYALVGESIFHDWRQNGARLGELLAYSKVRATPTAQSQGGLALGDGF
ncbi:DEAD/DEAH box helicase family protein [Rhodanobacter hydrolyticus]|uniref:DEAD/DEAH box helicase family protein n=1 Tax=Rhodanobacter hydrolyticus TaxID=2250595 RepID=A0ABW8J4S5_9GAMM